MPQCDVCGMPIGREDRSTSGRRHDLRSACIDALRAENRRLVAELAEAERSLAGNLVTACEQCNAEKLANEIPADLRQDIFAEISRRNAAAGILDDQPFDFHDEYRIARLRALESENHNGHA